MSASHQDSGKTADGLVLRDARADDVAQIAALSEVLGYPVAPDVLARRLERLLGSGVDAVYVVEAADGRIAGWTHAQLREVLESPVWCEIMGLVVSADFRRRGVATMLVRAVETWARGRGMKTLKVRSNAARVESHPFYEGAGFERFKSQHVYRKSLRD